MIDGLRMELDESTILVEKEEWSRIVAEGSAGKFEMACKFFHDSVASGFSVRLIANGEIANSLDRSDEVSALIAEAKKDRG